ncbi:MAG: hypothetical protein Q7T82_16870 [Armatimonadota bacterium]|nr:hypothetical protein [Armatimonadota bacterium]
MIQSIVGRMGSVVLIVTVLAALQVSYAAASDDADLVELVKAGTLARSQSITTFKGTVMVSTWSLTADGKESSVEKTITAVADHKKFRLSAEGTKGSDLKYDASFDGAKLTEWMKGKGFDPPVRIYEGLTGGLAHSDFSLFLNPLSVGNQDLSNISFTVEGRETFNGDECFVLTSTKAVGASATTCKTWVNTQKGFTVAKYETTATTTDTGSVLSKQVVTNEMRQHGEDVWGPLKHTVTVYKEDGSKTTEMIATYSEFQYNIPISADELKLTLPSGTEVYDSTLDATYTVP